MKIYCFRLQNYGFFFSRANFSSKKTLFCTYTTYIEYVLNKLCFHRGNAIL